MLPLILLSIILPSKLCGSLSVLTSSRWMDTREGSGATTGSAGEEIPHGKTHHDNPDKSLLFQSLL